MTTCEMIPLLPDTRVDARAAYTGEPVEVGPFLEGRVFVTVVDAPASESPPLSVDVGISPTGYDDWERHWHVLDGLEAGDEGTYSLPLENFGNWVRLRLSVEESDAEYAAQAWFVGKG